MKFFKITIYFLIALFLLPGCANELEINAPAKEIPVIFGLLDLSSKRQFIRVERAFIDDNISALTLASNPDNIYYENAVVSLIELEHNLSQTPTGRVIELEKVDAADFGFVKKEGIFATSPNYVYSTAEVLDPTKNYRLMVSINEGEMEVYAESPVIDHFSIGFPQNNRFFNILPGSITSLQWTPPSYIAYYDVIIRVFITEGNNPNPELNNVRVFDWRAFRSMNATPGFMNVRTFNTDFYNQLNATLISEPLVPRYADSAHIIIHAGGTQLKQFVDINTTSTGITASQDLPVFSNVEGGVGLLSTRYTSVNTGYMIGASTKDSLANNDLTRMLGFQE